jgi:hypothetical protein
MTTHAESIAMDVDSDHSTSGKSDTSQVSFTNDYDSLPSSGPTSHAHILDLGEYADNAKEDGMINLQDAIVTTLFCNSPDTLKPFLSPTTNTFKAIFGKKGVQLVISLIRSVSHLIADRHIRALHQPQDLQVRTRCRLPDRI